METYPEQVRIVFRDYPLPNHPFARPAAEAAQCANAQGKFWEYHDKVFENQATLQDERLKQFAVEIGIDPESFNACFDSGEFRDDVEADYRDGERLGVTGTPAFFINGRFISGAQPFEVFKAIIDDELGN